MSLPLSNSAQRPRRRARPSPRGSCASPCLAPASPTHRTRPPSGPAAPKPLTRFGSPAIGRQKEGSSSRRGISEAPERPQRRDRSLTRGMGCPFRCGRPAASRPSEGAAPMSTYRDAGLEERQFKAGGWGREPPGKVGEAAGSRGRGTRPGNFWPSSAADLPRSPIECSRARQFSRYWSSCASCKAVLSFLLFSRHSQSCVGTGMGREPTFECFFLQSQFCSGSRVKI